MNDIDLEMISAFKILLSKYSLLGIAAQEEIAAPGVVSWAFQEFQQYPNELILDKLEEQWLTT